MAECIATKECCLTCGLASFLNRRTYGGWDTPKMVESNIETIGQAPCGVLLGGQVSASHSVEERCQFYVRDTSI